MKKSARKSAKRTAARTRERKSGRPAARALKWAAVALVWSVVGVVGVVAWAAYDLPDINLARVAERPPFIKVLARDGSEIAARGGRHGRALDVRDMPPALVRAVLATEDRRFYHHVGIDPIGIVRAMTTNLLEGRVSQGGSTITQQVAKNLFLSPKRSYKRKIQEVLVALWLEARYSKDQILALYLNRVYFGAGTYGVSAAAERYFGRAPNDLGLYELAMIAGLPKAPSRYNPRVDPRAAEARTDIVLANMVAAGYLSKDEVRAAKKRRIAALAPKGRDSGFGYFTDWVLDRARAILPEGGDLVVIATLDTDLQRMAESHVKRLLDGPARKAGATQAALVALDPGGAVRAMVGGRSYRDSPFNRAVQARRQPGSAFKPFVYLAGLEAGLAPDSVFEDAPVTVAGWTPKNFANNYLGRVTMADALAKSVNTVAVRVSEAAGCDRVARVAKRLGLRGELGTHPSIALGVSEVSLIDLATAYAPFANGGIGVWAHGIDEILTPDGRVLYRRDGSGPGPVVAAEHLGRMNDMLARVLTAGTGKRAAIGRPAGGKTGTSQNFRDAWFVGYTSDLVAGVWFGNDDGAPMRRVTGGGLPAMAWAGFMRDAHAGLPIRPLPGAPGIGDPAIARRPPRESERTGDWFESFFGLFREDGD